MQTAYHFDDKYKLAEVLNSAACLVQASTSVENRASSAKALRRCGCNEILTMKKGNYMFDADVELALIRSKRSLQKRKRYGNSRLTKFKTEILKLKSAGASLKDIQIWLTQNRCSVVLSTIQRWLKKNG